VGPIVECSKARDKALQNQPRQGQVKKPPTRNSETKNVGPTQLVATVPETFLKKKGRKEEIHSHEGYSAKS